MRFLLLCRVRSRQAAMSGLETGSVNCTTLWKVLQQCFNKFDRKHQNHIMRTPTPFILLLVLLVSGCSTTDDGGNSPKSRKEASLTGSADASVVPSSNSYPYARRSYAPEPVKIEPALNRIAFRSYRVPVLAREDRIQKADVMKGLITDLGLVVDGKLELSEVTQAFEQFADRY